MRFGIAWARITRKNIQLRIKPLIDRALVLGPSRSPILCHPIQEIQPAMAVRISATSETRYKISLISDLCAPGAKTKLASRLMNHTTGQLERSATVSVRESSVGAHQV